MQSTTHVQVTLRQAKGPRTHALSMDGEGQAYSGATTSDFGGHVQNPLAAATQAVEVRTHVCDCAWLPVFHIMEEVGPTF